MKHPRIALIHATPLAIDPIVAAFGRLWPEARTTNLLDDSLSADLAAEGRLTDAMIGRFLALSRYVQGSGADAILFTCSAFGPAIEATAAAMTIPVLKPNEAMLDEALAAGSRIGLIATFTPSIPALKTELEDMARARKQAITVTTRTLPDALAALQRGDAGTHDRLIADAAAELIPCDALVLGQFSMASAARLIPAQTGRRVLTSPDSAVLRLKQALRI
ncbi:MAG: aspartate/glutamate racemase family protein [Burkholderiales bacterium]|nr:aspartate/glutamate racemase family protein [Burkholderiales bacterium]